MKVEVKDKRELPSAREDYYGIVSNPALTQVDLERGFVTARWLNAEINPNYVRTASEIISENFLKVLGWDDYQIIGIPDGGRELAMSLGGVEAERGVDVSVVRSRKPGNGKPKVWDMDTTLTVNGVPSPSTDAELSGLILPQIRSGKPTVLVDDFISAGETLNAILNEAEKHDDVGPLVVVSYCAKRFIHTDPLLIGFDLVAERVPCFTAAVFSTGVDGTCNIEVGVRGGS